MNTLSQNDLQKRINEIAYSLLNDFRSTRIYDDDFYKDFQRVAKEVIKHQSIKMSFLEEEFNLEYTTIIPIFDELERLKIISGDRMTLGRSVYVRDENELNQILKEIEEKRSFYSINYDAIQQYIEKYIENKKQEREEREKQEIKEKLLEKERKKQLYKQAFEELIEEGLIFNQRKSGEKSREPIPKDIMNQVWNRDGGKCVQCGSQENLEFDHIIPFSKGGATTYRNLQLLCQKCNREKSAKI